MMPNTLYGKWKNTCTPIKKKDFTPEESEELRRHYAEWFMKKCH